MHRRTEDFTVGRIRKIWNGELRHLSCSFSFDYILTIVSASVFFSHTIVEWNFLYFLKIYQLQ